MYHHFVYYLCLWLLFYPEVCFGHQFLARIFCGDSAVQRADQPEFGWTEIIHVRDVLFEGMRSIKSLVIHYDEVVHLDDRFEIIAQSRKCRIHGFKMKDKPTTTVCRECGLIAKAALITPPSLHGDCGTYANRRFPYYDEAVDKTFNSLGEKKQFLKDNNLRIKDPGERFVSSRTQTKDDNVHVFDFEDKADMDKKVGEIVKMLSKSKDKGKFI